MLVTQHRQKRQPILLTVRGVRRLWSTWGGGEGGWGEPGLVMGELRKRSEGGECWALTLLPCPSAGPGGGRPLLLPQRGGECSGCLVPGGAASHWIPGQSELPGKGGVVWAGQAVVSGLGPVFMSLSHFMGATESPGRLGKQLLALPPFPVSKMAWVGAWDAFNKLYSGCLSWESQETEESAGTPHPPKPGSWLDSDLSLLHSELQSSHL